MTALDVDIAEAIADEFGYKIEHQQHIENETHTVYHKDAGVLLPRYFLCPLADF